ncbi:MAG: protein-glutamate O-methyltransferase CheR [Chitinispirillales bacterium]|jgi:chemotaxis protein methyltransferase CheR|nr:protein-glutamate O-methyltransferase CheR [Chitinispirillales bacterium]
MDKRTFDVLRKLIYDKSGITLGEGKEALVSARIGKRLRALDLASPEDYLKYLNSGECDDNEFVELLDVISTNVTSFFREPAHFDFMSNYIQKIVGEGQNKVRIWCAASSSGEEPYTLAMTFLENAEGFRGDCRILATDISTRILRQAKAGEYNEQKIQGVPPMLRSRYFSVLTEGSGKVYKAKPEIADMITFSRLNLSKPPFPMKGPFDLIFCRNVMIYFDNAVRQKLLEQFERLLTPGGYLMVGHSESLAGLHTNLETVKPSVYYKKPL